MSKHLPLSTYHDTVTSRIAAALYEPHLVDLETGQLTDLAHIVRKPENARVAPYTAECIEYALLVGLAGTNALLPLPLPPTLPPEADDGNEAARAYAEGLDLALGPSPRPIRW